MLFFDSNGNYTTGTLIHATKDTVQKHYSKRKQHEERKVDLVCACACLRVLIMYRMCVCVDLPSFVVVGKRRREEGTLQNSIQRIDETANTERKTSITYSDATVRLLVSVREKKKN